MQSATALAKNGQQALPEGFERITESGVATGRPGLSHSLHCARTGEIQNKQYLNFQQVIDWHHPCCVKGEEIAMTHPPFVTINDSALRDDDASAGAALSLAGAGGPHRRALPASVRSPRHV
jgi:hypothetical protein